MESDSSSSVKVALKIAAAVAALLIALVALRFGFDICIDVCILGEGNRARRTIAEMWRRLCPWWNRRIETEQQTPVDYNTPNTQPGVGVSVVVGSHTPSASVTANERRREMALSILEGKILTADDVRSLHQDSSECSVGGSQVVCSICLHDFIEGDDSFTAKCNHIYHRHCLIEWMANYGGTDCPNCRTELHALPEHLGP